MGLELRVGTAVVAAHLCTVHLLVGPGTEVVQTARRMLLRSALVGYIGGMDLN